jgi:hypothetical protein
MKLVITCISVDTFSTCWIAAHFVQQIRQLNNSWDLLSVCKLKPILCLAVTNSYRKYRAILCECSESLTWKCSSMVTFPIFLYSSRVIQGAISGFVPTFCSFLSHSHCSGDLGRFPGWHQCNCVVTFPILSTIVCRAIIIALPKLRAL